MKKTYHGSCHCGAVRFEAGLDLSKGTFKCNCSICFKSRAWMAAVVAGEFKLISGDGELKDYQFGRKSLHHVFCARCGVRAYTHGTDAKGNKSYVVRVNCLDDVDPQELIDAPVKYFNMRHDDFKTPPAETRHL
jgi:hypothetical protein